jgi:hypothetical protein
MMAVFFFFLLENIQFSGMYHRLMSSSLLLFGVDFAASGRLLMFIAAFDILHSRVKFVILSLTKNGCSVVSAQPQ